MYDIKTTFFHGEHGAKITATCRTGGRLYRRTRPYDHELSADANHAAVAQLIAQRLKIGAGDAHPVILIDTFTKTRKFIG